MGSQFGKLLKSTHSPVENFVGEHSGLRPTLIPPVEHTIRTGVVINNKWKIKIKVGQGGFGDVFEAVDIKSNELFGMKFEDFDVSPSQLDKEYEMSKVLFGEDEGVPGFAQPHFLGTFENKRYLVMDLLGPSMDKVLSQAHKHKMPISSVLSVGSQALSILQYMHSKRILHRDVKPSNFAVGRTDPENLYVIDFGLAKMAKDYTNYLKKSKYICGTLEYMSMDTQEGIPYSEKDDLESLGYMLIELGRGFLPWENLCHDDGKSVKVLLKKRNVPSQKLYYGLPIEISKFLEYVRSLSPGQRPDYDRMKHLFLKAASKYKNRLIQ